mgnify:CR=1 FL=1
MVYEKPFPHPTATKPDRMVECMQCVAFTSQPVSVRGRTERWVKRCTNRTCRWAPYCNHHTPLYVKDSTLTDGVPTDERPDGTPYGKGVFVRGWLEQANGYPGDQWMSGPLPINKYVGDYRVGTDKIDAEEKERRYPGDRRGEYILSVSTNIVYDGAGPRTRTRAGAPKPKVVAAMLNDCLPGNAATIGCATNCHFTQWGKLMTGVKLNTTSRSAAIRNRISGQPIPKDAELFAEYGNEYWSGTVPGQDPLPEEFIRRPGGAWNFI